MVCKIGESRNSMHGPLKYNEDKVKNGVACLLGTLNVPGGGMPDNYAAVFKRLERRNGRTQDISFQMSINPAPGRPNEKLTDAEALSYAKRLMDGLGYKDQPIVVYKHYDIERVHYHAVTIRTDGNGRKIKDSFEEKNLQRLMARYAKMYHYVIGNMGVKETEARQDGKAKRPSAGDDVPRFDTKGANIRVQFDDLFKEAITYEFRNWNQFSLIMEGLGVKTDFLETASGLKMTFQGLDADGLEASTILTETHMGVSYYDKFLERMKTCFKQTITKEEKAVRHRAAYVVRKCIEYSRSEPHLMRMLARKGLALEISRTADGEPFGGTVVDHTRKRAYKLSELDRGLTNLIKETARPGTGRWDREAELAKEEWIRQKQEEKARARIQRNMDLAALQEEPTRLEPAHMDRAAETDWLAFALGVLETLLTGRATITRSIMKAYRKKTGFSKARGKDKTSRLISKR